MRRRTKSTAPLLMSLQAIEREHNLDVLFIRRREADLHCARRQALRKKRVHTHLVIVDAHEDGVSVRQLARALRVSCARVYQILTQKGA